MQLLCHVPAVCIIHLQLLQLFRFQWEFDFLEVFVFSDFDALAHPRFLRIFSTFATTKQSSCFRWLLFKLYFKSLNCRFCPRIVRMFWKLAVSILRFLVFCTIFTLHLFSPVFLAILVNHLKFAVVHLTL